MRSGRRDIEKIGNKLSAFNQIDLAETRLAEVVVHMDMEDRDVLAAIVIGSLHSLSDRSGADHGGGSRIVEVVVVVYWFVISGQN